eukprot:11696752-Alexandrium_andersonii.AAC.1
MRHCVPGDDGDAFVEGAAHVSRSAAGRPSASCVRDGCGPGLLREPAGLGGGCGSGGPGGPSQPTAASEE